MSKTSEEMKRAVESGYYPLWRFNPAAEEGKKFAWEAKEPKLEFQDFIRSERRYTTLFKTAPAEAEELFKLAEADNKRRNDFLKHMGGIL
jgi:pyruvate-ferredoxin/flavodoxin oxidoreductase